MKNVVLITVDCLRADHMSYYGYHRTTTPHLDTLTQKSITFTNAFSNGPNTRHSVPSFLTSTYPLLFLQEATTGRLHPARQTIAETLKTHGYTTAAIHSNPYISKYYGYHRGFDYFNDFLLGQVEDEKKQTTPTKIIKETLKALNALLAHKLPHETAETITTHAINWVTQNNTQPYFLWLHYMDVHMPYVPPNHSLKALNLPTYSHTKKIWMGKKIDDLKTRDTITNHELKDYINLYDGSIRYTDTHLNHLIKKLEQHNKNTIFIITSDHGEEFREHGDLSHIEKLYDELLHIPLIIYQPNTKPATITTPTSLIDLAPTILTLLNQPPNPWHQGTNLLTPHNHIIAETYKNHPLTAIRTSEWKLIQTHTATELYHLTDDPTEQHNLATKTQHKNTHKKLLTTLQNHTKKNQQEKRKRETCLQKQHIKQTIKKIKL